MKKALDPIGSKGHANPGKRNGSATAAQRQRSTSHCSASRRMIIMISLLGASLMAIQYKLDLPSPYAQSIMGKNERDNESHSNNRLFGNDTGQGEVPPPTQATKEVKERDSQTTAKGDDSENEHLVFIGDSTMRYSFLEFVDREHYRNKADGLPPVELVHEKYHKSWTSFFRYTTDHFEGYMACDCQRSENFSLATETENRYYTNPHNKHSYTYIQMYGDNMGHGRYNPDAVHNATISLPADDEEYDPKANENLRNVWGYMGRDMDQLILQYVAKLKPKPTTIIMNAGLWPNKGIAFNMEKIMRAAHNVTGGRVIWRGTVKRKTEASSVLSLADQAAKKMSYRIPGVIFQPFAVQNLTDDDYFDNLHFSNALPYRKWNSDLRRALEDYRKQSKAPKKEMAFLLSGAVRTLKHTHKSIFRNWIFPLCAPPNCIAHVVTHFSSSDNRPDASSNDPNGKAVIDDNGIEDVDTFFENVEWPDKNFLRFHKVPPYNIASDEERKAMDRMEQDIGDDDIASRLRIFRYGDPRRYSMWFARAYMWEFVKKLENERSRPFDFYSFGRPDVVWIRPSLTHKAFEDFEMTSSDIWVPDSYGHHPPDTMAFLPSHDVAETYFSLLTLVKPGVMCLGGPNFNTSTVSERLEALQIQTEPSDWCEGLAQGGSAVAALTLGISENILGRKLKKAGVKMQRIPAVAVIVRPPNKPDCYYMDPRHTNGYTEYDISFVGHVSCEVARYRLENGFVEPYEEPALFRLRGVHGDSHLCYTRVSNGTITALPCVDPVAHPAQMFSVVETTNGSMGDGAIVLGFSDEIVPRARVIDKETIDIKKRQWRRTVDQAIIETKGFDLEPLNQFDSFFRFHETGDVENTITYQLWKKTYQDAINQYISTDSES